MANPKTATKKYAESGVSIDNGEELVDRLKKKSKAIGGFAGLFPLDATTALVACTDGIGTKIELGIKCASIKNLGQDLVAMCVNDLAVTGATPLFFLDYYATSRLNVDEAETFIDGINDALKQCDTVLLGGETAEMPGFYGQGHFDAAGFAVGKVALKDVIDGSRVSAGDAILALPSSGLHSNGYSLVRKILADGLFQLDDIAPGEKQTWGEVLTRPTRLYVRDAKFIRENFTVHGMAHITGGGLSNIDRVLPAGLQKQIFWETLSPPRYMNTLKELAGMCDEEAYQVWNMGIGYVFVVPEDQISKMKTAVPELFQIGKVLR